MNLLWTIVLVILRALESGLHSSSGQKKQLALFLGVATRQQGVIATIDRVSSFKDRTTTIAR